MFWIVIGAGVGLTYLVVGGFTWCLCRAAKMGDQPWN